MLTPLEVVALGTALRRDVGARLLKVTEYVVAFYAVAHMARSHVVAGPVVLAVRVRHPVIPIHTERHRLSPTVFDRPKLFAAVETSALLLGQDPLLLALPNLPALVVGT
jgi:hypothetical protein